MRKLKIEEIDFRVGMLKKTQSGAFCTLLAYKDARVDMSILDETYGALGWQNAYKRDTKGVLQCGIGILNEKSGEWVWKWSNGTESNTAATKGEYSDAFKRAGFMWGIGRELYDMPTLFVNLNADEFYTQGDRAKQSNKFQPNKWAWTIEPDKITAIHNGRNRVSAKFDDTEKPPKAPQPKAQPKPQKITVKDGDSEYMKIIDGVLNKNRTIEQAKRLYNISEAVEKSLKEKVIALKQLDNGGE